MTLIAHVSDTHLDGTPRSAERVDRVVEHLAGLPRPVDAVLLTGDLADHGEPDEYAGLKVFERIGVPLLHLPGNHDKREPFVAAGLGPLNRTERVGDLLLALVDSTIPGRGDGLVPDATLEWLDRALGGTDPALVCFHHPPVGVGHPYADKARQFGEERLAEVIARHPNVLAILCGHFHTATVTTFAGVPVLIAPAVASTLIMPWEVEGGDLDRGGPLAIAYHLFHEGRLTTTFRFI
ncbi:metallophosphoesterase [Dactylosporangium sp. NPDC051485]|uniref:metallophosphoesterase n=1 Tax=Dactylosporangium sp. NPDC051485 TaxID=3154846 RepID=UPI00341A6E53